MDSVWQQFREVSISRELTSQLNNSTTALAAWVEQLNDEELHDQTRDSMDLIVDALALVPNDHDSAQDLVRAPETSNDRSANCCVCAHLDEAMRAKL